jgi:hypothetical protein
VVIEVVLEPVVRAALRVLLDRLGLFRFAAIELRAFEHHLLEAEQPRAVRIAFLLAMGMVLTVHGHPLARGRARVEPQPEAADVADHRMQIDGAVRLVAMEVDGDRDQRDVNPEQRDTHVAPEAQIR